VFTPTTSRIAAAYTGSHSSEPIVRPLVVKTVTQSERAPSSKATNPGTMNT